MNMEIEDDEAFLENLLANADLMGNRVQINPPENRLNPNAEEFHPAIAGGENPQNLPVANVSNRIINQMPSNHAGNQINPMRPENHLNDQIEQEGNAGDNENIGQNNVGLRNDGDLDRNDDIRRERLRNIILASENQTRRAREAYLNLFGPVENFDAREQGRRIINRQDQNYNDQRGNMRRPNNNEPARDNQVRNERDLIEGVNNNNGVENRLTYARNEDVRYNRGNENIYRDGDLYYNQQRRDLDQGNELGPMRNRRGGRNQAERDANYWRSRFFQLRNQSKKVKEFFFQDKY